MRKWTRERSKRRKPADAGKTQQESKPEPLQPKYFEAEAGEALPAQEPQSEVAPVEPSSSKERASQKRTRTSRRRRGRGGRGRGKPGQAQPATSDMPTTVEEPAAATEALTPPEPDAQAEPVVAEPVLVAEAEPSAPAPPVSVPTRASKGTVVLAIGLPGSGKSTWFKRHNIHPLSSDLLRQLLFDNPEEQRFQDLVFSNLRSMLKARLIARRPMNYLDATNLTPHDRRNWIKLAKDFGYDVQGVFFDVPLEVCLERNRKRSRTVSDEVMQRMSGKLRPPTFDEGFSKITVVRVKKKDDNAAD